MIIATCFSALLLVTKSHVPDAYYDLAGPARAYDQQMKSRYAYIENEKSKANNGKLSLSVKLLENSPRILVYSEISRDRKDWRNNCFARYFGLNSVATK
jgi:hypothetical protein